MVYQQMKRFDQASKDIALGEQYAIKDNNKEDQNTVHLALSDLYKEQGNFEEALKEYKTYKNGMDSLRNATNSEILAELQVQYDVEKNALDLELAQQEADLAKSRGDALEKQSEIDENLQFPV